METVYEEMLVVVNIGSLKFEPNQPILWSSLVWKQSSHDNDNFLFVFKVINVNCKFNLNHFNYMHKNLVSFCFLCISK